VVYHQEVICFFEFELFARVLAQTTTQTMCMSCVCMHAYIHIAYFDFNLFSLTQYLFNFETKFEKTMYDMRKNQDYEM
jgi:hypothetical protein